MQLQSESISKLAPALIAARKEFKPFQKGRTVKTGSYSYSYADLDTVNESVEEALSNNGLVITQQSDVIDGGDVLVTTLLHESGEFLRGVMRLPTRREADHQERGSAITYTRRYAITSLLNLTADEDDDAQATLPKNRPAPKKQKKNVTQEDVKEVMSVNRGITEEQVEAVIDECKRAGIENPATFAKEVITRGGWSQLAEMTPAEARAVIIAARKKNKGQDDDE